MSALAVVQANLIDKAKKPVTANSGGTSKGDVNAGMGAKTELKYDVITQGSRTGAGILTALIIIITVGGGWWMVDDGYTPKQVRRISGYYERRHSKW